MRYVTGSGGGSEDSGSAPRVAVEDPDSLQSHQYAKIVDLLSEGPIGGLVDGLRSVFLNETPVVSDTGVMNFTGVSLDYRYGTNDQSAMPRFTDVESETAVNTEIVYGVPVTRHVAAGADAVRVTIGIPSLTKQDITNGDLHGASVQVSVYVDNNGGGYQAVPMRYEWQYASVSGSSIVAYGAYGAHMTVNLSYPKNVVTYDPQQDYHGGMRGGLAMGGYVASDGDNGSTNRGDPAVVNIQLGPIKQIQYLPLTYRIEYAAPGGNWTLLVRETAPSGGKPSLSRSYQTPSGAYGTWQMRVIVEPPVDPDPYDRVVVQTADEGAVASVSGLGLRLVSNDVISGKTTSRYKRSYYIPLPAPGPWDVRVVRDTPTAVDSSLRNSTWWDSMTEIVESKLSYPNSAIVGATIDAEQFSDIPSRGYEIYGILCKVPSNYDPIHRKYTGLWNGTFVSKWTDNPVWIYYDLLTSNRYGLGNLIDSTGLDKWALYEIARYCDEPVPSGFGYLEPRFTCNCYIQAREDAYKLLTNMTSIFRGMAYWSAGQVTASCDMPSDPVALFANANVIDGVFTYSGSGRGARHTVALVTWNDPSDMFRQKVEYVDDIDGIKTYGVNQTEVVAFGCTSKGQAHRLGKWILYSERLETETVSFKTGLEGVSVYPGAIIKVADNLRSGDRIGGRILDATIDSVTLDQTVTIAPNTTYTLSVVMPEGATITHPDGSTSVSQGGDVVDCTVTNTAGETSVLGVTPNFSTPPQQHAMWILASANLEPQTFRVLSVSEADNMQIEVTALQHDPHKYDMIEYDREFPEPVISSIKTSPSPVTEIVAEESLYLLTNTVVGARIILSWKGDAARYEVSYTRDSDNPVALPPTASVSVDVQPIQPGKYEFRIVAISPLGLRSAVARHPFVAYGLKALPTAVSGFSLTALGGMAHLSWSPSPDLDVIVGGHLRVRHTPNMIDPKWGNAIDIAPQIPGSSTSASVPLLAGSYFAKWVDSSGNESAAAVAISTDAPNVLTMNFVGSVVESPAFAGVKNKVFLTNDGLVLTPAGLISQQTDPASSWPLLSAMGGIESAGEYLFDRRIDLGTVKTSRITAAINCTTFDAVKVIAERSFVSSWSSVVGSEVTDVGCQIHIRSTNDDPAGAAVWGAWTPLVLGDYSARAFEFKALFVSANNTHNIAVQALSVSVDMPDRVESGEDVVSGSGVRHVAFVPPFMVVPALGITAQNMTTGDYYVVGNKTKDGFDITFFNASGAPVSKTFDFVARAY